MLTIRMCLNVTTIITVYYMVNSEFLKNWLQVSLLPQFGGTPHSGLLSSTRYGPLHSSINKHQKQSPTDNTQTHDHTCRQKWLNTNWFQFCEEWLRIRRECWQQRGKGNPLEMVVFCTPTVKMVVKWICTFIKTLWITAIKSVNPNGWKLYLSISWFLKKSIKLKW